MPIVFIACDLVGACEKIKNGAANIGGFCYALNNIYMLLRGSNFDFERLLYYWYAIIPLNDKN